MCTKKERILQKLNPTLLKITPKLSGDVGSFIDLDSKDSLEDGAKKLMMRFLRNQDAYVQNRRNCRRDETEVTISNVKYNENEEICELITERLSLPFAKSDQDATSERPGNRLQKLKMELQEKISAKWEEEYKKRVSENKSLEIKSKKKKKSEGHLSSESQSGDEEDIDETLDEVENSEDNKNDEADVESNDQNEDISDDVIPSGSELTNKSNNNEKKEDGNIEKGIEDDDNEACSLVPAYQPGGGLLYGGSELTQMDEELPRDLLSPSLRLCITESPGSKLSESFTERTPKKPEYIPSEDDDSLLIGKKKLFSQNPTSSFDLSDAFEFCSGKFPDAGNSQSPMEGNAGTSDYKGENEDDDGDDFEEEDEDEEEDNNDQCQNSTEEAFDEPEVPKDNRKIRKNIRAFEDSEEEEEEEKEGKKETDDKQLDDGDEIRPRIRELLSEDEDEAAVGNHDNKKTRKSLYFSDEEDEGNDGEDEEENDDDVANDSENEERDNGDSDIEKADEEKEDCDERSVHYDSEENEIVNPREFFEKEAELSGSEWSGDEDERGLDEFDVEEGDADNLDSSQVRSQLEKIHIRRVLDDDAKEVRLIQEILFEDGDLYSDGKRRDRKFKWKNLGTFEDEGNQEETKDEGGNSSDDCAEEENLRKIRYEKELFLMTKKNGDDSSDEEITRDFQMVKVTRVKTSTSGNTGSGKSKAVTDYTEIARSSIVSKARGSFLTRNEEFLSRLAKVTSCITDNVSGPKHSRNFIFAAKSPEKTSSEKHTACKRQVEDTENCSRLEKRIKVLRPEVDTGPSILDLLI